MPGQIVTRSLASAISCKLVNSFTCKKLEIVVQVNRDFAQNGRRKYDGETSDGVPCSFAYSFLAARTNFSNLTVKIVAPRVRNGSIPSTTYKYKN